MGRRETLGTRLSLCFICGPRKEKCEAILLRNDHETRKRESSPWVKGKKKPGPKKAADQAANNFSREFETVTSDIKELYVKYLLVGGMSRIHTRVDKV